LKKVTKQIHFPVVLTSVSKYLTVTFVHDWKELEGFTQIKMTKIYIYRIETMRVFDEENVLWYFLQMLLFVQVKLMEVFIRKNWLFLSSCMMLNYYTEQFFRQTCLPNNISSTLFRNTDQRFWQIRQHQIFPPETMLRKKTKMQP
jgi:hypothetical protein